jgi:hypothetical protein
MNMAKRINSTAPIIETSQGNEEIRAREKKVTERLKVIVEWNCDEVIPK